MKTIQDLQKELDVLLDNADQYKSTKPPKKLTDEIKTVRQLIRYLETNPSEQMVRMQITETRRKLSFMPDRYDRWFDKLSKNEKQTPPPKLKAIFNKEHEVPKLRTQLQTLNRLF